MTEPGSSGYDPTISRRNALIQLGLISLTVPVLAFETGCHALGLKRSKSDEEEAVACLNAASSIPRRIYIATTSSQQRIVGGVEHQFVLEVVAALNSIPNCNAILLPPYYPLEALAGPEGMRPGLSEIQDAYDPDTALEEILLIDVIEMLPYRPMRLRAVLERRHISDGTLISRDHRTWNAPTDNIPLAPGKLNRFLLNRPQPLGHVEAEEMSRLSPQTFMRDVANQVAAELMVTPF
ncbi:MAG TPA: hypothetical protein VNQ76_11540 [Planctomicrobium sp.]|nr:hypothetical protein [Planctomicrobium sp.]